MNRFFLLAGLFMLLSCTKERLRGSGPTTTDERAVGNFTKVSASGSNNVYITKGTSFRVQVKGYSNLLPYFETEVRGSTLELHFQTGVSVSNDNVEVFVTMPELAEVKCSGSGKMDVSGGFASPNLDAIVSGSGRIDIADGTADVLEQQVSGSGSIRSFGLMAHRAEVYLSGSGTTEVKADSHLKVHISGSGVVYYKGSPAHVETSVSGSGKVVRRD